MVVPAGRARQSSRPHAAATGASDGLSREAEDMLLLLFSVQAELPVAQAVAVAAHTGCTARAALAFWKEQRDAWAQVMREAAQRAAAAAAAAAAAEGQAGGNGKAASVGAPQANQDVQGLIDALAAARAAATAKLRALQDASGEGLRDASVTGQFVSLIATLSSAVVRCRACAAITASSKLIRRKLVAAAGFLTTLQEWLASATAAEQYTLQLGLLAALESLPLEAPLLRSSGSAGLLRAVRKLGKSHHKRVSAAAAQLSKRWQAQVQGGSGGAAGKQKTQQQQQQQQAEQPKQPRQQQQQSAAPAEQHRQAAAAAAVLTEDQKWSIKDRPLFKKIVKSLQAAKGGSGGAAAGGAGGTAKDQGQQQLSGQEQQQPSRSAKRPRAEGALAGVGNAGAGKPPPAKRQQQERPQQGSKVSQRPQQSQQGAQQQGRRETQRQPWQAQVAWRAPPTFDPPPCQDPVAFGEHSTEVAAMAAARKLGTVPDADAGPAEQQEAAEAVPELPYVPPDAGDAQEQKARLRAGGWRPQA